MKPCQLGVHTLLDFPRYLHSNLHFQLFRISVIVIHFYYDYKITSLSSLHCVVTENIHTPPMEGYSKFPRGVGGEKSNIKLFPVGPRVLSAGNLSILHLRFDESNR